MSEKKGFLEGVEPAELPFLGLGLLAFSRPAWPSEVEALRLCDECRW